MPFDTGRTHARAAHGCARTTRVPNYSTLTVGVLVRRWRVPSSLTDAIQPSRKRKQRNLTITFQEGFKNGVSEETNHAWPIPCVWCWCCLSPCVWCWCCLSPVVGVPLVSCSSGCNSLKNLEVVVLWHVFPHLHKIRPLVASRVRNGARVHVLTFTLTRGPIYAHTLTRARMHVHLPCRQLA